jgi:hypothetical protein
LFLEQNQQCRFTGESLIMWGKRDGTYGGTASLDRIDSSKGYIIGNVQWVHKKIQHVKRNWSDEEFISLCEQVALHQAKKNLAPLMIPSFGKWITNGARKF